MSYPCDYGKYYWGISFKSGATAYFHADAIELRDGAVLAIGHQGIPVFCVAAGLWEHFAAVSCTDGSPVAIESWTKAKG